MRKGKRERVVIMVKKLSEGEFEEQVLNAPGREVVAFYAASNPEAGQIAKEMDRVAKDVAGNADIFWVDTEEEPALGRIYGEADVTYVLFQDGESFSTANGSLSANQVIRMATELEFGAD